MDEIDIEVLKSWRKQVISKYRSNKLTSQQIAYLENIPGWTWPPPKPKPTPPRELFIDLLDRLDTQGLDALTESDKHRMHDWRSRVKIREELWPIAIQRHATIFFEERWTHAPDGYLLLRLLRIDPHDRTASDLDKFMELSANGIAGHKWWDDYREIYSEWCLEYDRLSNERSYDWDHENKRLAILKSIHKQYPQPELAPYKIVWRVFSGVTHAKFLHDHYGEFRYVEPQPTIYDWLFEVGWDYILNCEVWQDRLHNCTVCRLAKQNEDPSKRGFYRYVELAHLDAAMLVEKLRADHTGLRFDLRDDEINVFYNNQHLAIITYSGSHKQRKLTVLTSDRQHLFSISPTDFQFLTTMMHKMIKLADTLAFES